MKALLRSLAVLLFLTSLVRAQPQPQAGSQLGYVALASFTNSGAGEANGYSPYAIVLGRDGFLYGLLQTGIGPTAAGAVFKMGTNGVIHWRLGMTNAPNPSELFEGADGNLYGLGSGVVFSVATNGASRWSTTPTNSGNVEWLTVGADGALYGACPKGGASNDGQIVSFDSNGVYRWVFSFSQTNGQTPDGPLTQGRDGSLYGATTNGGKSGQGVVFSIGTNGAMNWTYSFTGFQRWPFGELIQGVDGNLYGSANYAFSQGGVIFSISTNGATNWFYTTANQSPPNGTLLQGVDGNLYVGGANHVISLTTNGSLRWSSSVAGSPVAQRSDGDVYATAFTSLEDFAIYGIMTNGAPDGTALVTNAYQGTLVEDSAGNLFGAAGPYPGISGGLIGGQVFELVAAPEVVIAPRDIMDLNASAATFSVSAIGAPTLFYQWQKDGTNISNEGDITGAQSNRLTISPVSVLDVGKYAFVVSNYYGVVASPAAVLSLTNSFPAAISNGVLTLPNPSLFANDNLLLPYALTAGRDGFLYGSTLEGQLFKVTTNGTAIWHTGTTFGKCITSLTEGTDGNLYGCDGGGIISYSTNGGQLFGGLTGIGTTSGIALDAASNVYWTKSYPGIPGVYATTTRNRPVWSYTNGTEPSGVIVGRDGNLYACSEGGGTNNDGMIFSLTDSGEPIWSVSFSETNGLYPDGLVQASDGFLYGLTVGDFTNRFGSVFKMATNGMLLWTFSFGVTNGASPLPELMQATDGNLYGTTRNGGAFGQGTVFQITTNGAMTTVYSFTGGSDGGAPNSGPVQVGDGSLYGVAEFYGPDGLGSLYRLDLGLPPIPAPPTFETATISNGVITLAWSSIPKLSYQLQFSDDLADGGWSNLGVAFGATSSVATIIDTADKPQRFYRLSLAR